MKQLALLLCALATCYGMQDDLRPTHGLSFDSAKMHEQFVFSSHRKTDRKFLRKIPDDLKPAIFRYALLNHITDNVAGFYPLRRLGRDADLYGAIAFRPRKTEEEKEVLACVAGKKSKVSVWDVALGQEKSRFSPASGGTGNIEDVTYRPDSLELACAQRDGAIVLVNMKSHERRIFTVLPVAEDWAGHLACIAYRGDGKEISYACLNYASPDPSAVIGTWDVSNAPQSVLAGRVSMRHCTEVFYIAAEPKLSIAGHRGFSALGFTGQVELETGLVKGFPGSHNAYTCALNSSGNRFIMSSASMYIAGASALFIGEIAQGEPRIVQRLSWESMTLHEEPHEVAFNADDTLVAACGTDRGVVVYADYVKILVTYFSGYGPKKPTYDQLFGTLVLYERKKANLYGILYISEMVKWMNAKGRVTSMQEWKEMFDTLPLMVRAALIRTLKLGIRKADC